MVKKSETTLVYGLGIKNNFGGWSEDQKQLWWMVWGSETTLEDGSMVKGSETTLVDVSTIKRLILFKYFIRAIPEKKGKVGSQDGTFFDPTST